MMKTYLPVIGRHATLIRHQDGSTRWLCPPEAPVFAVFDGTVLATDVGCSLRATGGVATVHYIGLTLWPECNNTLTTGGSVIGRSNNPPTEGGGILVRPQGGSETPGTAFDLFTTAIDPLGVAGVPGIGPIGRALSSTTMGRPVDLRSPSSPQRKNSPSRKAEGDIAPPEPVYASTDSAVETGVDPKRPPTAHSTEPGLTDERDPQSSAPILESEDEQAASDPADRLTQGKARPRPTRRKR